MSAVAWLVGDDEWGSPAHAVEPHERTAVCGLRLGGMLSPARPNRAKCATCEGIVVHGVKPEQLTDAHELLAELPPAVAEQLDVEQLQRELDALRMAQP